MVKLNSFIGTMKLLSEKDNRRQKVELWLLNSEPNRNDWQYTKLKEHMNLFRDTPLLVAYVGSKIGDGHNMDEIKNADGTVTVSFMKSTAERIVGYFPKDTELRIEEKDGVEWVVGIGYIWTWYAQELVDKLKDKAYEGMSVSIETLVYDEHEENDISVFTEYEILGTTILGDDVTPAVAGANIKVLSELGTNEIKNMTLRVASENNPQQKKRTKRSETTMTVKKLQSVIENDTVLAVNDHAGLVISDKGELYTCEYSVADDTITVGDKIPVDKCSFNSEGDVLTVDLHKITGKLNSMLNKSQADYETEKTARLNAEEQLEKMKKAEHDRRIEAVKTAIDKRFSEICENREISCTVDELKTETKLESYAKMEDDNGDFCGDVIACKDVDAICMEDILAYDKKMAKMSNNSAFTWDSVARTALNQSDDVDKAFDNINGKGE